MERARLAASSATSFALLSKATTSCPYWVVSVPFLSSLLPLSPPPLPPFIYYPFLPPPAVSHVAMPLQPVQRQACCAQVASRLGSQLQRDGSCSRRRVLLPSRGGRIRWLQSWGGEGGEGSGSKLESIGTVLRHQTRGQTSSRFYHDYVLTLGSTFTEWVRLTV